MRAKHEQADIYCCNNGVRWCNIVLIITLQMYVKVCDTVQLLAGAIQCNGGKLEETEYFKCVFVVYCVLGIEIDQLYCVNC